MERERGAYYYLDGGPIMGTETDAQAGISAAAGIGPTPYQLTRRDLLTAGASGALILGGLPADAALAKRPRRRKRLPLAVGGSFPQGVAAGEPATNGATVWTRLEGFRSDRRLILEVAKDPGFARVVERRAVRATAKRDHTVEARVEGRFLKPGEEYFYRFETRDRTSPVGRFATLRPPDSRLPVRIAFFSCQSWDDGFYNAHRAIAAEDVDLVVGLGDYVYENGLTDSGVRGVPVGEEYAPDTETLERYRLQYRLFKSDPDLSAMHARHAFLGIWDDHEVENNYAGDDESYYPPAERTVPFAERRRNAYRAFYEYMPFAPVVNKSERGNDLYRRLLIGAHAELFLLDGRQYRDRQPCNDVGLVSPCPDAESVPRTMLGKTQLDWLKRGLEGSPATWKLLANQVMMQGHEILPGTPIWPDDWNGYGVERRELLGHVEARGIQNVSVMTGDYHNFFAADVGNDGRGPESVATEFVVSSISSAGLETTLDPRIAQALGSTTNPHLRYFDASLRGYMVVEATAEKLDVRFVAVDALTKGAGPTELAHFHVPAGTARVQRV